MFLPVFVSLIIAIGAFWVIVFILDYFITGKGYRGKKTDHFDGKHFYNIGWSKRESYHVEGNQSKFHAFMKWMLTRKRGTWKEREIIPTIPEKEPKNSEIIITFVSHATVLIQIGGLSLLTDPVWSKRTSPFSFFGPRRYVEPGVKFEDLPKIDVVLLSHNHYDHMDIPTLLRLQKKDNPRIFTGLGNKEYLAKYGISNVLDMDWWQTEVFGPIKELALTFVPAQHFSSRGITDRNKTLWGGFLCKIKGKILYFAGDTGYGAFVEELKTKWNQPIDIGLLPIGAYKPRWFMADIHTNPEEALMMQKELSIKTGIGIHYGTFPLADDHQDEPLQDLAIAQEKPEYNLLDFRVGMNGTVWKF